MPAHHFDVLLRNLVIVDHDAAEVPFALAGFVAQQVLFAGLAALELARRRHAKALLRGLMGLHLGHGRTLSSTMAPANAGSFAPGATNKKKKGP